MRYPPCSVVVAVACLWVAGCASDLRPTGGGRAGTGAVEGVVVDSGGRGVSGADVVVLTGDPVPSELGSGVTDSSGRFLVGGVAAGRGRVVRVQKVLGPHVLRARRESVEVVAGRSRELGEVEIRAGAN